MKVDYYAYQWGPPLCLTLDWTVLKGYSYFHEGRNLGNERHQKK